MTTVDAPNVHNVAVEGTFDDCQDLVKAMFADVAFRDAGAAVGDELDQLGPGDGADRLLRHQRTRRARPVVRSRVPTGNFGNIFAGWVAEQMGLPIDQLVIASNSNDILTRWVADGDDGRRARSCPTLSPSMDIQVSSNHERLLFELLGPRRRRGRPSCCSGSAGSARSRRRADDRLPGGHACDDAATLADDPADPRASTACWSTRTPRSASPQRSTQRRDPAVPMVCLATAHPAKFPDAVEQATGIRPPLPERLADLFEREEHFDVLPERPARGPGPRARLHPGPVIARADGVAGRTLAHGTSRRASARRASGKGLGGASARLPG